ncbi:hypothetical protein RHMOL_Rhmol09G0084600 [Rhododendron molle]|uniref:Uncharacterized protein n=1 Tax=Rhododendron molle TaxID=49168 RepID=A0ACC0MB71_RHOML|nr:hypothetical protein RHMOL_Rhmol09G0084600 [Rhododendron molle]
MLYFPKHIDLTLPTQTLVENNPWQDHHNSIHSQSLVGLPSYFHSGFFPFSAPGINVNCGEGFGSNLNAPDSQVDAQEKDILNQIEILQGQLRYLNKSAAEKSTDASATASSDSKGKTVATSSSSSSSCVSDCGPQRETKETEKSWGGSSRPDFTCKSTEETEAWFIDSFEAWRRSKNLSNFVLLGHSFGGYVAAKYALKHPEHIKHLILVGSAGFTSEEDGKSERIVRFAATWKGAVIKHLWESNFTPQKLIRGFGPFGPNMVRKYTSARFGAYSTGQVLTAEESSLLTDYVYHTLAAKASGELCLKYIFAFGGFTRVPLLKRCGDSTHKICLIIM